jgi:hypothetical protein
VPNFAQAELQFLKCLVLPPVLGDILPEPNILEEEGALLQIEEEGHGNERVGAQRNIPASVHMSDYRRSHVVPVGALHRDSQSDKNAWLDEGAVLASYIAALS